MHTRGKAWDFGCIVPTAENQFNSQEGFSTDDRGIPHGVDCTQDEQKSA